MSEQKPGGKWQDRSLQVGSSTFGQATTSQLETQGSDNRSLRMAYCSLKAENFSSLVCSSMIWRASLENSWTGRFAIKEGWKYSAYSWSVLLCFITSSFFNSETYVIMPNLILCLVAYQTLRGLRLDVLEGYFRHLGDPIQHQHQRPIVRPYCQFRWAQEFVEIW